MDAGRLTRGSDDSAEVKLILEDGSAYRHAGKLQFSEVTVDPGTGSVTLRAEFPNPEGVLMPGMFVRERIEEGVSPNGLLVPQQAVTRNYRGDATTLVVKQDGTVEERTIRADRAIGNKWLVTDGLKPGERVVVEGVQNVKAGARPEVIEIAAEELERRTAAQARPAQS
jgi:membrane fusion protein (multidrug efflux system)